MATVSRDRFLHRAGAHRPEALDPDNWAIERQPKTLVVWGRNDPIFMPESAEVYRRNVPAADVRYFDGGHFMLDEYAEEVADAISETFGRA